MCIRDRSGAFTDIFNFRAYRRRFKPIITEPEQEPIPKDEFERAEEFIKIIKEGRFVIYREKHSINSFLYIPEKKKYIELGFSRLRLSNAHSSYYWKHVAERVVGDYISNGALIASCILEKIVIRDWEGPNVWFELSRIPTLAEAFKKAKFINPANIEYEIPI